jgi:hypothetical protein
MRIRTLMTLSAVTAILGLQSVPADAGCGCAKPPPPLRLVRPAFASPGDNVTIFPPSNRSGSYEIRVGDKRLTQSAVWKRDLGDGRYKWQIVVKAPVNPMGPTAINVKGPGSDFTIPATDFTMMQAPIDLKSNNGETLAKCYSAAVTADHVVLIPLDISAITDHMIFNGIGESYPLLFTAADVTIYNTQGFLMQLLSAPNSAGIYAIDDPGGLNSLELTYDRHEFNTYLDMHAHTGGYGLDPNDPAWHTDGTYHVDHNHLVIAIRGTVENMGAPPAGKTPNFDLSIVTMLADATNLGQITRVINWSSACTTTSSSSGSISTVNTIDGTISSLAQTTLSSK